MYLSHWSIFFPLTFPSACVCSVIMCVASESVTTQLEKAQRGMSKDYQQTCNSTLALVVLFIYQLSVHT